MIARSVDEKIRRATELVLRAPRDFGLRHHAAERLTLAELIEPLIASKSFLFLTLDDLAECLTGSEQFSLTADGVRLQGNIEPTSPRATEHRTTGELYCAGKRAEEALRRVGEGPRVYDNPGTALALAGALDGTLEGVRLWRVRAQEIGTAGGRVEVYRYGVAIVSSLTPTLMEEVLQDQVDKWLADVLYAIHFQETLYLNDDAAQAAAAQFLYASRPKEIVERDLVRYLSDRDPDVRINVLTALGMPAYRVTFIPGAPLQPRDERLESAVLHPETVLKIVSSATTEADLGVLEAFICTLKSQSYQRSLKPVAGEVRAAIMKLLPRVTSGQTIRDCYELLESLP